MSKYYYRKKFSQGKNQQAIEILNKIKNQLENDTSPKILDPLSKHR